MKKSEQLVLADLWGTEVVPETKYPHVPYQRASLLYHNYSRLLIRRIKPSPAYSSNAESGLMTVDCRPGFSNVAASTMRRLKPSALTEYHEAR